MYSVRCFVIDWFDKRFFRAATPRVIELRRLSSGGTCGSGAKCILVEEGWNGLCSDADESEGEYDAVVAEVGPLSRME